MAKIKKKRMVLKMSAVRTTFMMPICLIVIGSALYAASNFTFEIIEKYKEKDELSKNLFSLKEEEQKLTVDVEKLQNPEYVGRYLREKFLYSKSDEYIIKLPQEEKE